MENERAFDEPIEVTDTYDKDERKSKTLPENLTDFGGDELEEF